MIDYNQSLSLPEAMARCKALDDEGRGFDPASAPISTPGPQLFDGRANKSMLASHAGASVSTALTGIGAALAMLHRMLGALSSASLAYLGA